MNFLKNLLLDVQGGKIGKKAEIKISLKTLLIEGRRQK